MLAAGPNAITVAEFLNHGVPGNVQPFYPAEDSPAYSCGWWAFRTTRPVASGEELLYDHGFWGFDLPYVNKTRASGASRGAEL